MASKSLILWAMAFALLAGASAGKPLSKHEQASVLNSPVDGKTVVRFFYDPAGDYFHKPFVLRVIKEGDPLLNTAPVHEEGQIAYITRSEMRELVHGLGNTDLVWRGSKTAEVLGSF